MVEDNANFCLQNEKLSKTESLYLFVSPVAFFSSGDIATTNGTP